MSDEATDAAVATTLVGAAWRRRFAVVAATFAVLCAVALGLVAYYASHLERVIALPRVQRMLETRHVTVSLAAGHLGIRSFELRGLEVRITKARKNAPVTLVALPMVRAEYTLVGSITSPRLTLGRVVVEGLSVEAMRYVRDEDDPAKGTDEEDEEADESLALARALVAVGRSSVSIGDFDVREVSVTTEVRSLTTGKAARTTVAPLSARASFDAGTLKVGVGAPSVPLRTTVTRSSDGGDPRSAVIATLLDLTLRPGGVLEAAVDVDLDAQNFDPRAPAKLKLATGRLHATTDERAGEVHVDTCAIALANGLVAIDAEVLHRDTTAGSVVAVPVSTLAVHPERLSEVFAESVASRVVVTEAAPIVFTGKNLRFGANAKPGSDSSIGVSGAVRTLDVRYGQESIVVSGLVAAGAISFSESGVPAGRVAFDVARIEAPGDFRVEKVHMSVEANPASVPRMPSGSGPPAFEVTAKAALERARRGADRIEGLDIEVHSRVRGLTFEGTSMKLRVDSAAQETNLIERARVDATGPSVLAWGKSEPFDTASVTTLRAANIRVSGAAATDVTLRVETAGSSRAATFAVTGEAGSLEVLGLEGRVARTSLKVSIQPSGAVDLVAAKAPPPTLRLRAEAFGALVRGDVTPREKGADVDATLEVPSIAPLSAFVPSRGVTLCPKSLVRASIRSAVHGFASPSVVPAGELALSGIDLCNAPTAVHVRDTKLHWDSMRPSSAVALAGNLAGVELDSDGVERGATIAMRGERRGPRSGAIQLDVVGASLPDLHVAADATFGARQRNLTFSLDARAAKIESLPSALRSTRDHGLDALASAAIAVRGSAIGFIDRWDDAGLALAPGAFTNSTGKADVRGAVDGLRLHGNRRATVALEHAAFEGAVAKTGRSLELRARVSAEGLDAENLAFGGGLAKLEATLDLASPDGERVDAHARASIVDAKVRGKRRVSLGDVSMKVDAQGSRAEAIGITRLEASSSGLGTSFEATGSIDLRPRTAPVGFGDVVVVGRESGYLRGVLTADLAALTASVDGVGAKGRIRAPLVVAAGDRSIVRVDGTVELQDVSVDWGSGRVEGVDGRIPVDEEIRLENEGPRLVPVAANAFSRERFEDQQPLVAGTAFVRVKRLAFGDAVIGPLGASVRIERNTLALERFEMTALGGSVGGRCFVDLRGADTRVDFRGDVTGLAVAADKKPLDAHIAIRLKPWRRTLDGRVDVARTSAEQVRLMLDLYDPYQENVSANRARQALVLGYPRSVRTRFHDGLASVALDLGGLGAAVRVDEIRGVPIAPMLEKSLLPKLPKEPPRL